MNVNNPYLASNELTAFRRNKAFTNGDADELLLVFNTLIEENLNKQSYSHALLNLWSALSICEQASNQEQVKWTLNFALNFSPFLHQIDDYTILIESIVTQFIEKSNEITSTAYFVLSVLFLNKNQHDRAYNYAKMAHFYALELDALNNQPYLCNAQLQLVFSKLLMKELDRADAYISSFGWDIENCTNDQERALIHIVQLLKGTLSGVVKEADLLFFGKKLASSSAYFYPLYLLMQMKQIVHHSNTSTIVHKIEEFYTDVKAKTMKISPDALTDYYLLRNRLITNSNLFFMRAEQLFKQIKSKESEVYLGHFTGIHLSLPNLYDFTLQAPNISFLLYPLHQSEFLVVYNHDQQNEIQQSLEKYLKDGEILLEMTSKPSHARFIDLYVDYTQHISHYTHQ